LQYVNLGKSLGKTKKYGNYIEHHQLACNIVRKIVNTKFKKETIGVDCICSYAINEGC
jgi:hypothetical protein